MVFFTVQAFSMELSAEQKELWEGVKTGWEVFKKGDMDVDLTANYHKDLIYWGWFDLFPRNHEKYVGMLKYFLLGKVKSYEIKPIEIRIVGNVAILMYSYNYTSLVDKNFYGKSTQTYIKQDGKWLFLGGMSGSGQNPSRCP